MEIKLPLSRRHHLGTGYFSDEDRPCFVQICIWDWKKHYIDYRTSLLSIFFPLEFVAGTDQNHEIVILKQSYPNLSYRDHS